jgi:hypothetical protein
MNLKRTMSEALQTGKLSEEACAFLSGGAPRGSAGSEATPNALTKDAARHSDPALPVPTDEPTATASAPTPLRPPTAAADRSAPVSMTFRLPAQLPEALLRAAMERKLRHEEPFTQQDIVAEAVREWLDRHGRQG